MFSPAQLKQMSWDNMPDFMHFKHDRYERKNVLQASQCEGPTNNNSREQKGIHQEKKFRPLKPVLGRCGTYISNNSLYKLVTPRWIWSIVIEINSSLMKPWRWLTLADVPWGETGRPCDRGGSRCCAGPAGQRTIRVNISDHVNIWHENKKNIKMISHLHRNIKMQTY